MTGALTPPIDAVTVPEVYDKTVEDAAAPVAGWFETGPKPVQKIVMYSPGFAARDPA